MFSRRMLSFILALCLIISFSACKDADNPAEIESTPQNSEQVTEQAPAYINPLTGEALDSADKLGKKPVAFTINNVDVAQKVQSGVGDADIIFETEVEGGITRLLAVFYDPAKIKTIGTIRSLRIVYSDIACGLDAIMVHNGIDPAYCAPYVKTISLVRDSIGSAYSYREKNGLAYEHTLYSSGDRITKMYSDKKYSDMKGDTKWVSFEKDDKSATPTDAVCTSLKVPFSSSSVTNFTYDSEKNKYIRANSKNVPFTDCKTGEKELFTNVFVLKTTMSYYSNNYHRNISLSGGSGYYISGGGIKEIKWTKGSASDPFKFTTIDGAELKVNTGNSYVCIVNDTKEISYE